MKFSVTVTLQKDVLDPQGKVVQNTLQSMGMDKLKSIRQGKYFEIETIKFLKWISYLLLSIFLVGIFSECLISIDSSFNDSLNLNFQADNFSLSLPIFALILWVLSHIFSQGVKMKKLNDLTI